MELIVDKAQYKFLMNILFDFDIKKSFYDKSQRVIKGKMCELIDQLSATA